MAHYEQAKASSKPVIPTTGYLIEGFKAYVKQNGEGKEGSRLQPLLQKWLAEFAPGLGTIGIDCKQFRSRMKELQKKEQSFGKHPSNKKKSYLETQQPGIFYKESQCSGGIYHLPTPKEAHAAATDALPVLTPHPIVEAAENVPPPISSASSADQIQRMDIEAEKLAPVTRTMLGDLSENVFSMPWPPPIARDAQVSGLKSRIAVLERMFSDTQQALADLSKENETIERKNRSLHRNHVIPAQQERDEALKMAEHAQKIAGKELKLETQLHAVQAELLRVAAELVSMTEKLAKSEAATKEKAAHAQEHP